MLLHRATGRPLQGEVSQNVPKSPTRKKVGRRLVAQNGTLWHAREKNWEPATKRRHRNVRKCPVLSAPGKNFTGGRASFCPSLCSTNDQNRRGVRRILPSPPAL